MRRLYKPVVFLIVVVFLGLLQLWVTWLVYLVKQYPVSCDSLLRDGAVFFFATSLACSQMFIAIDKLKRKGWAMLFAISSTLLILIIVCTCYSTEITSTIVSNRLQSLEKPVLFEGILTC